jgi:DNA-binding beta-propeller fold protein YncE/thiol-disulfide isomerase/thioredoxin
MEEGMLGGTNRAKEFPPGLDWLNTDRPLTLAELKGKIVILDFWTYGCINCMHVIPDLKRLEREYRDELVVIGVHSAKFANESQTENLRLIAMRYGLVHPVVNDRDLEVWCAWGVRAWPTLIIIDPSGKVVGRHSGEGVYPLFKPIIERLVREFEAKSLLDRTPLRLKPEKEQTREGVLSFPGKVLADVAGKQLFVADTNHNRVLVVDVVAGLVLDVIGSGSPGFRDGDFGDSSFDHPQGMALDGQRQILYVADTGNHAVRQIDLVWEEVTTVAGTGHQSDVYPPRGGTAPNVDLNSPWDLALDGERLYIAMAGSHQIWVMDLGTRAVRPFAGSGREGVADGPLLEAELAQPSGLALDGKGYLYFADSEGSSIRRADTNSDTGRVDTLVGSGTSLFEFGDQDGTGSSARLQHPLSLAHYKGKLYVADTYNSKIKRLNPDTREIETLAGGEAGWCDGATPLFWEPGGIDADMDKLFIADTNNHAVRVFDLATLEADTLIPESFEISIYLS